MRANIRRWVASVADRIEIPEPIYEFGSFRVPGQEELADMRPLFPGKNFTGCDMREGLGVDLIIDVHDLDYRFQPKSIGTILCLETFEHVRYPHVAMEQFYYVLKEGGVLILTSTMAQTIHNHPSDYWRFTPEGFGVLLEAFTSRFIDSCGEPRRPLCVVGVAVKEADVDLSCLEGALS